MSKSSKGGNFERQISRFFTKWLTGQDKELYFWRSPGSGSVAQINMGNKAISGDIIALKQEATILIDKCSIEAKNGYKEASFSKHLKNNKSDPLKSFWEQCCDDATKADKLPLLIYKKLGMSSIFNGISPDLYNKIKKYLPNTRFIHLKWDMDYPDTYFFELNEFWSVITPEIIKKLK